MANLLRRLNGLALRRPFAFACGSAVVKSTSADVLVQTAIERRDALDAQRTAAFALFGLGWMGAGQYLVYVRLLPALLPATTTRAVLGKVALDQFVHVPFVFMPLFYLVDGWVQGAPLGQYARAKWEAEIGETLVANWKLWLPGSFVSFKLVPDHLRIPYVSCLSFAWTTILSLLQGRFRREQAEARAAAASGSLAAAKSP
jgi:hypothetical protein